MPTYDKPTWQLITDALADLPEVFTTDSIVSWFRMKYPKIKDSTVRAHLLGMSVNSPARRYYPGLLAHGLLYKIDSSRYTRYDSQSHGMFNEQGQQTGIGDQEPEELVSGELAEYPSGDLAAEKSQFVLEQHLEEFLEKNWNRIDFGMPISIWMDDDGQPGRQYPTEVGRIDFLCTEQVSGAFVVVELKRGRTSDAVVGQCQRYMGWVKRHLEAEGRPVLGLIIASDLDERLRYALEVAPNIKLRLYRVKFELAAPEDWNE